MAKRQRTAVDRFRIISYALSVAVQDHAEDLELVASLRRRSPRTWMDPYLRDREDPTQRNTLAKLEADFVRLGCFREFRKTTRMLPDVHMELVNLVKPLIERQDTNWRKSISPIECLSLTIRYLTRGDSVSTLHQGYLVGESSVLPIIRDTCRAIYRVLSTDYMKTPNCTDDWLKIAQGFHDNWNFPHVLGAIDGKHIRIKCPRKSGSLCYNYKKFFSIVLLGMCDAEYNFTYVDVGAEGKASDSTLWSMSNFARDIEDPHNPLGIPTAEDFPGHQGKLNYFFVADDAFGLGEHLMKPYPSLKLTAAQRIFNYRLSRARRVIENSFGILSSRFRILRREIDMEPEGARDVVMACMVLHNYIKACSPKTYMARPSTDWEAKDYRVHRGLWRREVELVGTDRRLTKKNHSLFVKNMRQKLMYWCLTKEGECKWQYDLVLQSLFIEQDELNAYKG